MSLGDIPGYGNVEVTTGWEYPITYSGPGGGLYVQNPGRSGEYVPLPAGQQSTAYNQFQKLQQPGVLSNIGNLALSAGGGTYTPAKTPTVANPVAAQKNIFGFNAFGGAASKQWG